MQFGDDVYNRVVSLLQVGKNLRGVDFSIVGSGRIVIDSRGFRLVGEKIRARAIVLAEFVQDERVHGRGEAGAQYDWENNMMLLNPAKVQGGLKDDADLCSRLVIESAIVHEAVHALFDILKQPMRPYRNEAAGYLAEELFWKLSKVERKLTGWPVREAANRIIDAFGMAEGRGTVLSSSDIRPLEQAIHEHPLYHRRRHPFNRRRVPHDGVGPRPETYGPSPL